MNSASPMPSPTLRHRRTLAAEEWRASLELHRDRAKRWTDVARERKSRGEKHPVQDFLFTYYFVSPTKLEQWHPRFDEALVMDADLPDWLDKKPYTRDGDVIFADPSHINEQERMRLEWILELMEAVQNRPALFGCHGLHEWAMIYTGDDIRHRESLPLRLTQKEVDEVVRSRSITCTHYDAFRFFHKTAKPMNRWQPCFETRMENEQAGCIHTNMDLYKWAAKAMPWIGADLMMDCFEMAMELREVDMRASPYDLSEFDMEPICIETVEGRREYEAEQRRLSEKTMPLRSRLVDVLRELLCSQI